MQKFHTVPSSLGATNKRQLRPVEMEVVELIGELPSRGTAEAQMFQGIIAAYRTNPQVMEHVLHALQLYVQLRHILDWTDFWEPGLAKSVPRTDPLVGADART